MPHIILKTSKFDGLYKGLNGSEILDFGHLEMIWASITLGFQKTSHALEPRTMVHRLGLGLSAVSHLDSTNNEWKLHEAYSDLDPSEKTSMSYWHGMIFTKLVASRKLGIKHLIHADRVMGPPSDPGSIVGLLKGKRKGDFVGRDASGNWHAIESKGRSVWIERELTGNAKEQAKNLSFHEKGQPKTTSVCVTKLNEHPITIYLQDPPPKRGEGKSNDRDRSKFWLEYYGSLTRYIQTARGPYQDIYRIGFPEFSPVRKLEKKHNIKFAPLFLDLKMPVPVRHSFFWSALYVGLPEKILNNPNDAEHFFSNQERRQADHNISGDGLFVGPDLVHLISI